MKVLIGCEKSQEVCKAFRALGHEAYSCDIQECSGGHPEWHLQMDVTKAIMYDEWDLIGLHPVCTKMALSGNRHYGKQKLRHDERLGAVEWTISLWVKACEESEKVYMENPMGAMNTDTRLPKCTMIQPWQFGHNQQKTTCLWLHGLPPLIPTEIVDKGEFVVFKSGKKMAKWYADTPSTKSESNRAIRSKTYSGIAKAMAEQWGGETKEVSECCSSDFIPPDWDAAEEAGSMWRAYVVSICKKCGKVCETKIINK